MAPCHTALMCLLEKVLKHREFCKYAAVTEKTVTVVSKVDKLCPILLNYISGPLHRHLQHHGVDYLQFSFRWMNNLLTRELPLHCTIRLWDTYLAESDGFASFQLYVCAAFLLHWRRELLIERDFQVIKIGLYLRIWYVSF